MLISGAFKIDVRCETQRHALHVHYSPLLQVLSAQDRTIWGGAGESDGDPKVESMR